MRCLEALSRLRDEIIQLRLEMESPDQGDNESAHLEA